MDGLFVSRFAKAETISGTLQMVALGAGGLGLGAGDYGLVKSKPPPHKIGKEERRTFLPQPLVPSPQPRFFCPFFSHNWRWPKMRKISYLCVGLLLGGSLSFAGTVKAGTQTFVGNISDSMCGLKHMMPGKSDKECTLSV